jgi:multiple sugar transport system ATP-binding protein
MVFQNYALYPHKSVYANMAFGLQMRKFAKAEIEKRVREAAEILGIQHLLDRKPRQLSGGQRQRVALGRAIVRHPQLFLFDEPLSNLDAKLRVQMRVELKRLHERLETTAIYVTHDQVEAMTLGDRVVVMKDGVVQQVGEPMALYGRPANRFVAGFIGSPAMNFIDGVARRDGAVFVEAVGGVRLPLPADAAVADGQPVTYGIRPEHLDLAEDGFEGEVAVVEPTGSETQVFVRLGDQEIVGVFRERHEFAPGQRIRLRPRAGQAHLFDAAGGGRI